MAFELANLSNWACKNYILLVDGYQMESRDEINREGSLIVTLEQIFVF